jgi:hypothetical protein
MALARIITRSDACSRELALDLLARGYAVEIVSPDSVPDNIADLELRVDAGPGDQLTASVETHHGERSASLEFVHHLKAPMVDFIRRPPKLEEAVYFPEQPVSFNAEPNLDDGELLAAAPEPAPTAGSPAADILLRPELDREEGARLIAPPDPLPSLPAEPPSHFTLETPTFVPPIVQPTIARPTIVRPVRESQQRDRSAGWFWRAALTFASVVLLALVLGFGMRRTGKASAQSSGTTPAEKVAVASTDVELLSAVAPEKNPGKDPGQVPALATVPPAIKPEANSGHAPKESPVAKAGTSTASTGPGISRRHGDGLIARDTVTYLDKRFEPRAFNKTASKAKPAKRFARQHPSSRKHDGGVIAANSVTYLNTKPAPKAAKPDSGIKQYSDLK